jgi:anhydro-N-acetylmuramic acid kinase
MKVLGIMSGTSLDGLDLALVEFKDATNYQVLETRYVAYSSTWRERLNVAHHSSAEELMKLDIDLGKFIADAIIIFKNSTQHAIDIIACHGHTIFHQPNLNFSTQIGNTQWIATHTGIETIADFRTKDVCLGGNGAPLVPIGDELLFGGYDACLNVGGIANISFRLQNQRVAYDICPANMLMNPLAKQKNLEYDEDGAIAKSGSIDLELFDFLQQFPYYNQGFPKSLGRESVEFYFFKKLLEYPLVDAMHTVVIHIASQIGKVVKENKLEQVLVTGGGAKNSFLMYEIEKASGLKLELPDDQLIDFKEAIVFAYLGYLRKQNKINVMKSVTGAKADSCSGVIYQP